jgi:hypothetical protein
VLTREVNTRTTDLDTPLVDMIGQRGLVWAHRSGGQRSRRLARSAQQGPFRDETPRVRRSREATPPHTSDPGVRHGPAPLHLPCRVL